MPNETPAVNALDSADLSIADYRALREGKDAAAVTPAPVTEEKTTAADAVETEADAETTDSTETESLENSTTESKAPKKDKIAGRFSELTAKIKALESQLATQKSGTGQPEKTESTPAEVPTLAPDPKDPEPAPDKFADYVEWQKAWNRWDRRQDARQEKATAAVAAKQTEAKAKADTWQSRVSEATAELADFATVAQNPDLPVTQAMAEAITDSEVGPKILYHLGQNPDEAARIAKLSPLAQIRAIGKIESSLEIVAASAGEGEDVEPPTKKPVVSKAPPPHKPIGGAPSVNPAKNIEGMSQREYRALREAGKIR